VVASAKVLIYYLILQDKVLPKEFLVDTNFTVDVRDAHFASCLKAEEFEL